MSLSESEQTGAEHVSWNLSDLYPTFNDGAFVDDMNDVKQRAQQFNKRWHGKIVSLGDEEMLQMITQLENINETIGRLATRVRLDWTTNSQNDELNAALQATMENLTTIRRHLIFVSVELRNISDEHFKYLQDSPTLAHYRHWLEFNRQFRKHTLSEAEEVLDAEKDMTGLTAWVRFFDQMQSAKMFNLDGRSVTQQELMQMMAHRDRDVRRKAAEAFTAGLDQSASMNAFVFNTVLADRMLDDRIRGYSSWISSRNMANKISDESVDILVQSVVQRYDIPHRFFALKKRLLGLDDFYEWDRNAPATEDTQRMSWSEAQEMVSAAYHKFHPSIGAIVDEFFEKNWIDAALRPGKQNGAYASPAVPSVHPYIFMNYTGTQRDVKTLAHELGHGVHQYLSRVQGYFNCSTPLTIAETASVFGEMLVFDSLMNNATNDEKRLTLLMEKLNDIINTVFRQIALNRFEDAIHNARRSEGELSPRRFAELWMQTQLPSYGSEVTISDNYRNWWTYISHFIHTPGYVYAYAFGELLVLALYEIYKEDDESFKQRYIDLLSAGGRDTPDNLLKPFGIDLADPQFWSRGLQFIDSLLTQAEEIVARRTA